MRISEIKFNIKFSLSYINGKYILSGFDHLKSLHLNEKELTEVLNSNIEEFNQEEWNDYMEDFNKRK